MRRLALILCLLAAPASALVSIVNDAPQHGGGGGGNIAVVTHGSGATANSPFTAALDMTGATLIVVNISSFGAGTITDSVGTNTYTQGTCNVDVKNACLYYVYAPSVSSTMIFNYSGSSVFAAIEVIGFSGTVGSSMDQSSNQGTATAATTCTVNSSITPSTNNQVVVSGFGSGNLEANGQTYSVNSGMTISDQNPTVASSNFGGAMAYKIQTTATAIQPVWTDTAAANLICSSGSFQ